MVTHMYVSEGGAIQTRTYNTYMHTWQGISDFVSVSAAVVKPAGIIRTYIDLSQK